MAELYQEVLYVRDLIIQVNLYLPFGNEQNHNGVRHDIIDATS